MQLCKKYEENENKTELLFIFFFTFFVLNRKKYGLIAFGY